MNRYLTHNIISISRYALLFSLILCLSFPFSFLPLESHSNSFQGDPPLLSTQTLLPVTSGEFASLISVIHLPPPTTDSWSSRGQLPSLNKFVARVENGQKNTVSGVYVPGFFALPVVQQPSGNSGYVSGKPETVTQFQLAARYNVLGFLAHNYLSGTEFFRLLEGLQVVVVKGDGSLDRYRITAIDEYQKVTPGSNWSQYIDLETGERLTTYQVFGQYYQGEHHLTFQTCLARDGIETWGLRFIVAEPID
jgi:hypothetical protein